MEHEDVLLVENDVTLFFEPYFDLQYLENYKYYEGRWPLIGTQLWLRFLWDAIEILNAKILKNFVLGQGPKGLH